MNSLYYECHVTVEPVFAERLEKFAEVCATENFHVAKLLMQKRETDTPERSAKDSFCTGHSQDYADIEDRMLGLIIKLRNAGFQVWRYKIEDCVLDSRKKDVYGLLDNGHSA